MIHQKFRSPAPMTLQCHIQIKDLLLPFPCPASTDGAFCFTLNHRFYHNCITAASAKKTRRGSGQLRQNWICAGQQGKHEAFRRAAAALWLQMPNTQSRQPLKRGWLPAANNEAESRPWCWNPCLSFFNVLWPQHCSIRVKKNKMCKKKTSQLQKCCKNIA